MNKLVLVGLVIVLLTSIIFSGCSKNESRSFPSLTTTSTTTIPKSTTAPTQTPEPTPEPTTINNRTIYEDIDDKYLEIKNSVESELPPRPVFPNINTIEREEFETDEEYNLRKTTILENQETQQDDWWDKLLEYYESNETPFKVVFDNVVLPQYDMDKGEFYIQIQRGVPNTGGNYKEIISPDNIDLYLEGHLINAPEYHIRDFYYNFHLVAPIEEAKKIREIEQSSTLSINMDVNFIFDTEAFILDSRPDHWGIFRRYTTINIVKATLNDVNDNVLWEWSEFEPEPEPEPELLGIKMVSVPGGTFDMGGDDWRAQPVHQVTVSPFLISQYEITVEQYQQVKTWGSTLGYSFRNGGEINSQVQDGNIKEHPVVEISWYDAALWCNALSEIEGRTPAYYVSSGQVYRIYDPGSDWYLQIDWEADGYRLPTEAEWEYACRAGSTTEYSFGDDITPQDANYATGVPGEYGTSPVGSYAPNKWGLYDMHGNVWEWCWDVYSSTYDAAPALDPHGPVSTYRFDERTLRGGGGGSGPELLTSYWRAYDKIPSNKDWYVGFRPVISQ